MYPLPSFRAIRKRCEKGGSLEHTKSARHRHEQQTAVGVKRARGLCWNSNKGPRSVEAVFRKQQDSSIPDGHGSTCDMWLCGCHIIWTPSALRQTLVCVFPYVTEAPQSGHLWSVLPDCALWAHLAHLCCRKWFLQLTTNMGLSLWNLAGLIDEYYCFILG